MLSLLTAVGAAIGLVGGLFGIASFVYVRRQVLVMQQQTRIMQEQLDDAKSEKSGYVNWSEKYEQASTALIKIYSKAIFTGPSNSARARDVVFPDRELREAIDRHLRKRQFWPGFSPATLSREQLGNPVVQRVIDQVLASVDKFKQEHPDWARTVGLLP